MDQVQGSEPTRHYNASPISGSNNVARETEVAKEVNRLRETVLNVRNLSEEITMRLAAVLVPRDTAEKNPENQISNPQTPLASTLHEIGSDLMQAERNMRLIIAGLEL